MILADKIIRLRKKNGWSQEELAEKMHVTRQAVSKWEAEQTISDLEKILRLGRLLGVTTITCCRDNHADEKCVCMGSSIFAVFAHDLRIFHLCS